jgi:hypothetical protein
MNANSHFVANVVFWAKVAKELKLNIENVTGKRTFTGSVFI